MEAVHCEQQVVGEAELLHHVSAISKCRPHVLKDTELA